jgi:hypothetical protein
MSHYAAPPTYYLPCPSVAATISPGSNSNPNPSFDQVPVEIPVSVPQGVDASLTSPFGYTVPQYQTATYAAAGDGLAAYFGSMPTVGPIHPVSSLSLSLSLLFLWFC